MAAAFIAQRAGRKSAMLVAGFLFLLGTLLCALAPNVSIIIGGRVVLGLGVGLAAFSAPLYIAEISPESQRGTMISIYQLIVCGGMLLAFLSDSLLAYGGHWRWMLGILLVPTVIFIIAMLQIPYSPRWLVADGQKRRARAVLMQIRGGLAESNREIARIEQQLRKEESDGLMLLKTNRGFRKTFSLGVALQALQQLTGINVILYYAPHILEKMGFSTAASIWCTVIFGAVNLTGVGLVIYFIDRVGRRPLLMISTLAAAIMLGGFGFVAYLGLPGMIFKVTEITLLALFVFFYAVGSGPMPWTLCAEIQPLRGRTAAIAASTFTNWVTNWLIANIFLSVMAVIHDYGVFWLLAGFNLIFFFVTVFFVPETKGCSLEDIEENLNQGKRLRDIGA
ncbi:sugar porter family MFS transporter [Sorlinia euscelidii]|uniref:sugar porter family MFS transporter n=1 Tax=Sorlinia euscelidii TaxID=3081148 RepID=UPI00374E10B7